MGIKKLTIQEFLPMTEQYPVLDVRSPGEYNHAHIPGALSLPLFTDEERKVVGTAYKQESREKAIKIGLDYFGTKMRSMVETVEALMAAQEDKSNKTILVHCWRGGMRSAGVAWLLDLYGFRVFTLTGGYKAYRAWARSQFEQPRNFSILGGFTGSGKTLVIQELQRTGHTVIDLEGIAHHKGSVFGHLGEKDQPTQEMFENKLAMALYHTPESANIWMEDESQRIGNLNIPNTLWKLMRGSPVYFLAIPFEVRLQYLTEEYGKFDKAALINAIIRIQKRLGPLETKTAVNFLLEDNTVECFRILLAYYDKGYEKGLNKRENLSALLKKLSIDRFDIPAITRLLLHEKVPLT